MTDKPVDQMNWNEVTWEKVSLPHTAMPEPKIMHGQWQGTCWYSKKFQLDRNTKGKRLMMRFEGAMNVSDFWINGKKVASHLGGFLPVVFDFTDVAKIGTTNEILIRLDNTDNPITGPKPMKNLDFNMYGGLYRDAYLIIKDPLHISDPVLANKVAGGGVFITYPKVSGESATVHIKTNIVNTRKKAGQITVVHEILDNDSLIARYKSSKLDVGGLTDIDVESDINLENPRLWSPQSPFLYTLRTLILSGRHVVDKQVTQIGIRDIKFTKEGFYINGKKMFLRGVNRHQEYPYVGYALSNAAQYRDALKIKEAGFDYVRLSHYPHSPAFMDACDELGLVVVDAILGWQYYVDTPEFKSHVLTTCRELIRRDRNHPCVIAWELSLNESGMDTSFMKMANTIGHEEYPGNQSYTAGWKDYAYDIYLQARQHRLGHYRAPDKPYIVSEYGDWEYYAMNAGFNQDKWADLLQQERSSRQLLSDGETRLLQQALNAQEAHNDNFNTSAVADGYWDMFDYNRGYSDDLESSGIMSIDRLPKFSYYFFRSQRDATDTFSNYDNGPMVYIASWWTTGSPVNVRIYSNCEKVGLFLNGKDLGIQTPDSNALTMNLSHPPFTFNVQQFEPGELRAEAYIQDSLVASHTVRTPEKISGLEVVVDTNRKQARAGCNDVVFVHACLVDKNGTIIRLNSEEVTFEIRGDAKLLSPETINTESGIASGLILLGGKGGAIGVIARYQGLVAEATIHPL